MPKEDFITSDYEFSKGNKILLEKYSGRFWWETGEEWEKRQEDKQKYDELNDQTLQKIKNLRDSIITKNGEPLAKIDLAGAGMDKLRNSTNYGPIPEIEREPRLEKFRDWVQLSATGDGNCFLHAFSVFLN